jgi:hypothetical protein
MQMYRKLATVAVAGGVAVAGLSGVASADSGCTGVAGQPIDPMVCVPFEYTSPPPPSRSDEVVRTVSECIVEFAIGGGWGKAVFDRALGGAAGFCVKDVWELF